MHVRIEYKDLAAAKGTCNFLQDEGEYAGLFYRGQRFPDGTILETTEDGAYIAERLAKAFGFETY